MGPCPCGCVGFGVVAGRNKGWDSQSQFTSTVLCLWSRDMASATGIAYFGIQACAFGLSIRAQRAFKDYRDDSKGAGNFGTFRGGGRRRR